MRIFLYIWAVNVLKYLPKKAVVALSGVINASFRLHRFPLDSWPNHYPKTWTKHAFPQNYRQIILLSTMGNVTERVILSRRQQETENYIVIENEQFDFRQGHSTTN